MPCFVYIHTSTVSGKSYVGICSRSVAIRFREHCQHALLQNSPFIFHRAIRKYGRDAWVTEVLHEVDTLEETARLEQVEIEARGTFTDGYNMTAGGEGTLGAPMSEENRERLSEEYRKRWEDPEYRARMERLNVDYKHDEESKAKRSAKLKGRIITPEWREKLSGAAKARAVQGNPKTYLVTHPDGTEEAVVNLTVWCAARDIRPANMRNVVSGQVKSHRGYACRKA